MSQPVRVPSVGESITEVTILKWLKQSGEAVRSGEAILEIESDKATVEVAAETAGVLKIGRPAGERVKVGDVVGEVDPSASPSAAPPAKRPAPALAPETASYSAAPSGGGLTAGPAAQKMAREMGLDLNQLSGTGKDGRVTKGDLLNRPAGTSGLGATAAATPSPAPAAPVSAPTPGLKGRRERMSSLRAKIAERLVSAQHTAAILTTFNEVDMTAVNTVRNQYKDKFKAKFGVGLGYMSFFTRASVEALKKVPIVNAMIDGPDVVHPETIDIGVAVGTERGLVVPILRNAGKMGFLDIERGIAALAEKARVGKLSIADMSGGTFTISNGGVYGSLMSTPILNPPQSAILGMHKIQERPAVVNGKLEVRPMMYLAVSYDHRLIDGKEAVTFLIAIKEGLENPQSLGLDFTSQLS